MRRREFLALTGAAAAALPLVARAQQKMARVGVLLVSGPQVMGPYRDALRDLGCIEGENIEFDVRSAQGQSRPASAAGGAQSARSINWNSRVRLRRKRICGAAQSSRRSHNLAAS